MPKSDAIEALGACFEAQSQLLPFNGVVLVERGPNETFARAVGFADEAGKIPIHRNSRFRLASVTKLITRAAIARLIEQGRISFDGPVGSYVPGLPAEMQAITIEQLLNHRSGVAPLETLEGADYNYLMSIKRATDLLPLIVKEPLQFAPGSKEKYSNGGFMLLGIVIEAVTGKTYGDYVEESVYRPLGMGSSSLTAEGRMALPLTTQNMAEKIRPQLYPHWNRVGVPSGNSVSTADDLMKLGRALVSGKWLTPAVQARAFPQDAPIAGIFGSGASAGVDTAFVMSTKSGWRVIVLSNHDAPAGEMMTRTLLGHLNVFGEPGCNPSKE